MRPSAKFACYKLAIASLGICLPIASFAQGGSFGARNPFSAPDASVHIAPDRMYDLENLALDLNVDYEDRLLTATATNTIKAIRDGVTELRFHAGTYTKIESVEINGQHTSFTRDALGILVPCTPTKTGQELKVAIHYHLKESETKNGGARGWHWHEAVKGDPSHVGLWTNGEPDETRDWAVTWDYPNDFTTSETRTTVPKNWQVIGNGNLMSDHENEDGKTRTVVWKMTQPHATYLTSIVAGPFDIHHDRWRGVPLYYVAPKGMGKLLDYSFAHTKDMLSFYSDNLGVKYPWPKYALDCTYDFGGGQENVSATTFGIFLTDPRSGWYEMDNLTSHELGHQWFGDYVTCKDWGQIWLNESFATVMEMTYTAHSRGKNEAQREFEENSAGYFQESRRYKRPLATTFYSNPGVMFDQHTYPKGGALLYSLKNLIGNDAFYGGLHRYLTLHGNTPVETNDLCEALTDSTGINMHPWFDQWILKPGHPVIDWSWKWDDSAGKVIVNVKQTQDTTKGTPIYDVPTHVGLIYNGEVRRVPIQLNAADQSFSIALTKKPDAVLFDPDHEFLREITKQPWSPEELLTIAEFAPDCVARQNALNQVINAKPSEADLSRITAFLQKDKDRFPAIEQLRGLANLKDPALKPFWVSELKHENIGRRQQAISALASLPSDPNEVSDIRKLVNDTEPYAVVGAAIGALEAMDYEDSKKEILAQATTADNAQIRTSAIRAVLKHDPAAGNELIFKALDPSQPAPVRGSAMTLLSEVKGEDPRIIPALRAALQSTDFRGIFGAIRVIQARKIKELIPDLEAVKAKEPRIANFIDEAITAIKG